MQYRTLEYNINTGQHICQFSLVQFLPSFSAVDSPEVAVFCCLPLFNVTLLHSYVFTLFCRLPLFTVTLLNGHIVTFFCCKSLNYDTLLNGYLF